VALSRPQLLVLRALGLGDFLTGVPALRALRRAFPSHDIVLACPPSLSPLVATASAVDRVLSTSGLEPLQWQGPSPELAVNLHGRGPQSHRVLQKVAPQRLVAFGSASAGHQGPKWRSEEHEVTRWCRMVEESLGIPADPGELLLPRPLHPQHATTSSIVLHPGAAFPSRRWPVERFAEVARWAIAENRSVLVTGGSDEVGIASDVQRLAGLPPESVIAGRTNLMELANVVASASLVVCGDTGVAHLATAFATPSVVLFGPMSPEQWGHETHPALMRISVDEVIAAADLRLTAEMSHVASTTLPPASPEASNR
jgi:ADP-heptose:LPS heptosyltransferase